MFHRRPESGAGTARCLQFAFAAGLVCTALLAGCGGGGGSSADTGGGSSTPPVLPGAGSSVTLSGQVDIGGGAAAQRFVPLASAGGGRGFAMSLVAGMGRYTFPGTVNGASSSTTVGVEFWQGNSIAPDVVTVTTAADTFSCGGLTRRACTGLTTTVAGDRRSLTFRFEGVVVKNAGETATRTLDGQATAQFPAALPYVVPSDLPTHRSGALTLDGTALGTLVATVDLIDAMPPAPTSKAFTLSATAATLSELPWGTANLGDAPASFYCVTPNESGACSGLSLAQTPAAATYRFANVTLKQYLNGVVLPGRRVLDGTLALPYPQASVNQGGTSHTLVCGGDACTGSNFVFASSGNIRHTIAVEQRAGGAANNGMTSIGYSYDLFNPADRQLTILPGPAPATAVSPA